jgi:hypothetical protein
VDPVFASVRDDARFRRIVEKIGLNKILVTRN